MASFRVSGATLEELEELREVFESWDRDEAFEEKFCLAKIPCQPDDYDGPPRYCQNMDTIDRGDAHLCKYHGGAGEGFTDEKRKDPTLAPITHGMNAALENLVRDFDEKDQRLYDWITTSYADAYDLAVDEDPATEYDLHRLAAEIVRAERGRGFLLQEGEVHEKKVRNEEGRIVTDRETGEIVTEKSEHYLAQMMHRQDKKITQLEKELGISRKERLKQDTANSAVESIKNFAEIGETILQRGDHDYSGDEAPWEDE